MDVDGTWNALKAGETILTVSSYTEKDVSVKIKVVVLDSLYTGILKEEYANTTVSDKDSWDLDTDHALPAQDARYDDWHLVMVQTNQKRRQRPALTTTRRFSTWVPATAPTASAWKTMSVQIPAVPCSPHPLLCGRRYPIPSGL